MIRKDMQDYQMLTKVVEYVASIVGRGSFRDRSAGRKPKAAPPVPAPVVTPVAA